MRTVLMEAPAAVSARVMEIFASRQGEGLRVGEPHLFVRFGGCNLACDYCDTPGSIPKEAGRPMDVDAVLARLDALDGGRARSVVSLTGGEPLLHVGFLEQLLPRLKAGGRRVYLETNGTLPRALERVIRDCDWVAMDFKPASATGRDSWEAHRWFLNVGAGKTFVKLVLTDQTSETELDRAVELIQSTRRDVPLVLQPATASGTARPIPLARLAGWWALAVSRLRNVRILPQIHPLWQIP